jgi:2-keto-3-deoxy-L-rhamnonate aldolase RhmA
MTTRPGMPMLKPNKVKQTLEEGGVCFGTMLRILDSPHAVPLCATAGWDFVVLDTEHQQHDYEGLAALCLAAKYEELAFLVRVPDKLYHLMARPLDLGAEGLVIPRVETPEEVRYILQSSRYAPLGRRGASISSIATRFRDCGAAEFLDWSNRESLIVIQIESQEAVDRVDELVSIEGVDAALIGPFDLSQSLGIPGELDHPRLAEAYERVIAACARHGVAPGAHLQSIESVHRWREAGMRLFLYRYDIQLFLDVSCEALQRLRSV